MNLIVNLIARHKNLFLFLSLFIFAGLSSVFFGQDNYFDLQAYHLYNPYALLNGRFDIDIIPAGMHTFFNPLADVPYYILLKYLSPLPRTAVFLMGIFYAACAFFTIKIVFKIFKPASGQDKYYAWVAALLGCSGVMAFGLCGASSGDLQSGMFILAALYFIIRDKKIFWLAGLLLGMGFGLKFTNGPFVPALFAAACIACYKESFFKNMLIFGACFAAGFLLMDGYFMYILYKKLGNPFFPHFNGFFKSVWYEQTSARDLWFMPETLWETISLPFTLGRTNTAAIGEPSRDLRIPFACIFSFLMLIDIAARKLKKQKDIYHGLINEKNLFILCVFWVVSYILWVKMFAILRYLAVIDFLTGIIITAFVIRFINLKEKFLLLLLFCGIAIGYTVYPYAEREPFKNKTVLMSDTKIKDGSLVLLFDRFSYLIPFSNPNAVYMGGIRYDNTLDGGENNFYGMNIYFRHNFRALMQETLNKHTGPIYVIEDLTKRTLDPRQLAVYGLKIKQLKKDCNLIKSNIHGEDMQPIICEVQKADFMVAPERHPAY